MSTTSERTVLRAPAAILLRAFGAVVLAMITLNIAAGVVSSRVATVIAVVVGLSALGRVAAMRVELNDAGLLVHNFWSRHDVAWLDVVTIDWEFLNRGMGAEWHDTRFARPRLRLRNGRTIDLASCQAWHATGHRKISSALRRAAPEDLRIHPPGSRGS